MSKIDRKDEWISTYWDYSNGFSKNHSNLSKSARNKINPKTDWDGNNARTNLNDDFIAQESRERASRGH